MANYQSLKAAINAVIKANGNKEITGTVLNEVLLAMVNSLGAGYQFAGVATPDTTPGTPDQKVFYIASQAGTYTNFGGAVVSDCIAIFEWNGIWTTETLDLPIPEQVQSDWTEDDTTKKSYIKHKPNIPAEQVQSDWTETDTTKKSYIKHKPNIPPSANVDPVPTNGSPNAVASGGVYNALKTITDFLNNGYYFVGIAGTSTVPDSVTQYGIFYIASDGGTYTNFLNGDDKPLTLYQGLNILYKDVEDDGWNYFEVFKFSDFVDTTQQQSLSSQQKAQALANIAAVSYDQQSLNADQKVQAQNNMMGKAYDAATFSGLGKKVLAKNIIEVSGVQKNVMEQSFFQDGQGHALENTVYVIQYDYTIYDGVVENKNISLSAENKVTIDSVDYYYAEVSMGAQHALHLENGLVQLNDAKTAVVKSNDIVFAETSATVYIAHKVVGNYACLYDNYIIVPNNCVLKFDGGSIKGGTLVGNKIMIVADDYKLFDKDVTLYNFKVVQAAWLGIVPDTDCSEELVWFSKMSLSIVFNSGEYRFTIADLLLSYNTELIGATGNKSTVFNITPSRAYGYLIGLAYMCSIYNIHIKYNAVQNIANGDIIRVSNKFARLVSTDEDSDGSVYQFRIYNVLIDGEWVENSDYSNGVTAIKIETNSENNPSKAKALSWMPEIRDIYIRFSKVGVHLQSISPSGSRYWQNSIYLNKLVIHAKYGIWFDRQGGWSHGHCMVDNYIFQSTEQIYSFGLYGVAREDNINNYYSWDNHFLGCIRGVIYLNNTANATDGMTGMTVPEGYTYQEGFLVEDGKTLRINVTRKACSIYTPNDYDPLSGSYILEDFSERGVRKFYPDCYDERDYLKESYSAATAKAERGFVYYNIETLKEVNYIALGTDVRNELIGRNQYVGRNDLMAICALPSLVSEWGKNEFVNNYNGKTTIFFVSPVTYDISVYTNIVLKIEVTYSSDIADFTNSKALFESVFSSIGTIDRVHVLGKKITFYIRIDNGESFQYGLTFAVTAKFINFADTVGEVRANKIDSTIEVTLDHVLPAKYGTSANRPNSDIVSVGFEYFDITVKKPIWWTGDTSDNKSGWVDATGADMPNP